MNKKLKSVEKFDGLRADFTFIDDIVGKPLSKKPNEEELEKLLKPMRERFKEFEFTLGEPTVFKLDDIEYPTHFVNIKVKK